MPHTYLTLFSILPTLLAPCNVNILAKATPVADELLTYGRRDKNRKGGRGREHPSMEEWFWGNGPCFHGAGTNEWKEE